MPQIDVLPTKLYSPLKKKKSILYNMINYNNNFLNFIYKHKNKRNYIEANIERGDITRIRFLKPRKDFTSTKKIFEYKYYRVFNINTIFNTLDVYGKIKLELDNVGAYFKNIKLKKTRIKSKLPWYITYNYIRCIQNYLFLKSKSLRRKAKKYTLKTIQYSYNKFKLININIKRKIEIFYKMKFSRILTNFRNNWVVRRNYLEFIIPKKQKKLITTFRIRYGIFWSIFTLLNELVKQSNLLLNNWNVNNIDLIIIKKYILIKSLISYLIKLSFYTLKRASFRYLYFARHLIIYFYSYLSTNILLNKKNNIINSILNKTNESTEIKNEICDNKEFYISNIIIKNKYFNKHKLILDIFGVFLVNVLNMDKELNLFKKPGNKIKLNIDLYVSRTGRKVPAHFLNFVIFLNYFKYSFKKLLPKLKLKKKDKKKNLLEKKLIKKNLLEKKEI